MRFFSGKSFSSLRVCTVLTCACLVAWGGVSPDALVQAGSQVESAADFSKPTFVVPELKSRRDLRLLIYGDQRFTDFKNTEDTWPRVRKWLAEKVGEEPSDAMFVTGDIPFHGSDPADWKVYRSEAASWYTNHRRIYPTLGNHEVSPYPPTGRKNYFATFPELGGHAYYSVLLGNVMLINVDSTQVVWPGGAQAEWIRAQLDNIPPAVDFVFFMSHIPLIADVQSEFIANIPAPEMVVFRRYLEARALTARQKFIMINGHIHNYERFETNGITHIISGGGGAKPYPVLLRGPQDQYRDTSFPVFNYVLFQIHGKHAEAKMYKVVDASAKELSVAVADTFSEDAN